MRPLVRPLYTERQLRRRDGNTLRRQTTIAKFTKITTKAGQQTIVIVVVVEMGVIVLKRQHNSLLE
jgi:hypothetical protein